MDEIATLCCCSVRNDGGKSVVHSAETCGLHTVKSNLYVVKKRLIAFLAQFVIHISNVYLIRGFKRGKIPCLYDSIK